MKWTSYTPLTWTRLTHARMAAWARRDTRIHASGWCRRVAYVHINQGVRTHISHLQSFGNLVPNNSSLRHYSQSIVSCSRYVKVLHSDNISRRSRRLRNMGHFLIQSGSCIHLIVRTQIKWSARIHFLGSTPTNNCVLLPVTVLQYISSINYNFKLIKVLHLVYVLSNI